MSEIKKIMVAIGFTEYSQAKFSYATKLAVNLNAQLIVANVINIRDVEAISKIESMGYKVDTKDYVKGVKEDRMADLDKIVEDSGFPKEKLKIVLKVGHPFDALMKVVKEEEIDLVVIGAKGRIGPEHILLGSVAEKMIRHSPIPVLTFRSKST
ncbi:universal stress protein [bacterium]|nr:universal stress protein [bacterium]